MDYPSKGCKITTGVEKKEGRTARQIVLDMVFARLNNVESYLEYAQRAEDGEYAVVSPSESIDYALSNLKKGFVLLSVLEEMEREEC